MTFSDLQKDVVKSFLHSAVLVDDNIVWSQADQTAKIDADELLQPDEFDNVPTPVEPEANPASPRSGQLEAKPIIQSFSNHGIVCSPYTWGKDDNKFPNASEKADLLILDWRLEDDPVQEKGTYARNFIRNRLENDARNKERLRFISIYTAERSEDVLQALKGDLGQISGITVEEGNVFLDIISGSGNKTCRIGVISKNDVSEDKLADRLIEDFTNFVKGFLPNILLASVAEIRSKTYEYLAQYHQGLDLAVITHYTALNCQKKTYDTSEIQFREYVANLIASRIQNGLILSENVKKISSKSAIVKFIKDQDVLSICSNENECSDKSKILKILRSSTHDSLLESSKEALTLTGKQWSNLKDGKHPLFFRKSDFNFHLELCSLDLLTRSYLDKVTFPTLRLGTILKHKNKDQFFLCIQPLCDGIRLDAKNKKRHSFPFLKLTKVESGSFDFVVPYEREYVKLVCEPKPRNIESFGFLANEKKGDVRGKLNGNAKYPVFRSTSKDHAFKWLGELKMVFAQETLNLLAHEGSRVGSDKFEWLRKQS